MDIILGAVLVVLAKFRATDVLTLRCSKLSFIFAPSPVLICTRVILVNVRLINAVQPTFANDLQPSELD